MNWYKVANKDEMKKYFIKRTNNHISLVRKSINKIIKDFPEFKEELEERAKVHDDSKFEEPEMTPYISLTWRKRPEFTKEDEKDLLSEEEENEATLHHCLTNKHHPEYHLEDKEDANIDPKNRDKSIKCVDVKLMPNIDLAEMVADWQSMSEELGTNTSREWFDEQKDVRWEFSKSQEALIDKLLEVFE
jgi:hypothetical protein